MKKLALTLALSLAGIGAASAQTTPGAYDLGAGRLVFQGGLTTSGCNVVFNGSKQGTGDTNDYVVNMPNGLAVSYLEELPAKSMDGYTALEDRLKRSAALRESTFSIGIECPSLDVVNAIQKYFGAGFTDLDVAKTNLTTDPLNAAELIDKLNAKGVLAFYDRLGAGEGGFVEADVQDGSTIGVLNTSPSAGEASGVGVLFVRANKVGGGSELVDLKGNRVSQALAWTSGELTGTTLPAVKTQADYDFAYVLIGSEQALNLGNGKLSHIVSFRFQYDNNL